ncbi:MAG: hypothetical protein M0Z33_12045 [Actinomycetota bacterium]|nr:hypothetical protein [Actinomycetota bacterium]
MDERALDEVRDELRRLADRLGDLAYDELRRAVSAGEGERPDAERRLARARRAVERAISILSSRGADGE